MFRWTKELTEELYRLRGQGLSIKDISERLGVDAGTVKNKLKNDKQRKKADAAAEAKPVNADKIYMSQLQEILKEEKQKTETLSAKFTELKSVCACYEAEIGELRRENAALRGRLEHSVKLMQHTQQPVCEPLEEIYALADCLAVINFEELMCQSSAIRLVLRIMDICDDALLRLKEERMGIVEEKKNPHPTEPDADLMEILNFEHPHCTTKEEGCQEENRASSDVEGEKNHGI